MITAVAAGAVLGMAFASLSAAGLAMDRHYEQVTGRYASAAGFKRAMRAAALLLAAGALACCRLAWGEAVSVIAWLGFLSCGAFLAGLMFAYAPRRLPLAAGGAGMAGTGLWMMGVLGFVS